MLQLPATNKFSKSIATNRGRKKKKGKKKREKEGAARSAVDEAKDPPYPRALSIFHRALTRNTSAPVKKKGGGKEKEEHLAMIPTRLRHIG